MLLYWLYLYSFHLIDEDVGKRFFFQGGIKKKRVDCLINYTFKGSTLLFSILIRYSSDSPLLKKEKNTRDLPKKSEAGPRQPNLGALELKISSSPKSHRKFQ